MNPAARSGSLQFFQNIFSPASLIFSGALFRFIAVISSFFVTFHVLDSVQDNIGAYWDVEDTFDFVVVGGGSAGAVVANRLSENYKVLLLEAGGEPNPLHNIPLLALFLLQLPNADWQYYTQPQENGCLAMNNRQCSWPRGKGLGGSSNLNFLVYVRGHKNDFNSWANISGDPRWAYENVLPFFKRSEDYEGEWQGTRQHSVGGPLKVSQPPYVGMAEEFCQAYADFGVPRQDMTAAEFIEGCSPIYSTIKNGRRFGTFGAFLDPIRDRTNLLIRKFSHVTKVLFGPGNEAQGVEYIRHGIKKKAFATREVILSAGALNSPQILMLSGIGPKEHLESFGIPVLADLPVGQNLQDHVSTLMGPFIIDEPISLNLDMELNAKALDEYSKHGTGPLSTTAVEATAFYVSNVSRSQGITDWPDVQQLLVGQNVYSIMASHFARVFNVRKGTLEKYFQKAEGKNSFQIMNLLSRPLSKGRVTLSGTDPTAPPLMDANYFAHEQDLTVIAEGALRAVEIMENSPTFKAMNAHLINESFPGCEHVPFKSLEYWKCYHQHYSLTVYHPTGTCAMGRPDSPHAVVDSELRVLGTRNLRVVDASIMPHITIGNTNAPTIMIGEMGSHLIASSWSSPNDVIR